ncbi:Prolyl 4-hydroxylase alpha subunit domain-containing protein [Madurella fahalii]|uniref:Prolyl 4-hydroxylase alpha subunit domain-containing protein n=1 Tax=Madurella fahalii TaxID=1157608 RepID=A0ABQ0GQV0_9PEZI
MFTYILAVVPILLFFSDPISQLFSPSAPRIRRLPRPQLNADLLALEDNNNNNSVNYTCPHNPYTVHIYSREPLVLYVENFLSPPERTHLLEISEPLYQPSTITHDAGKSQQHDPAIRDSLVALVPRTETVRCVEDRARALQGWQDQVWIERLRVQRYAAGGHYAHHFDWSSGWGGWGRVGSFMVWVDDGSAGSGDGHGAKDGNGDGDAEGLVGGGTEFPLLRRKEDGRWCAFVECGEGVNGTVFKVVPGNAVYWENFRADGTGRAYDETWHAGLPVEKGVKVGLNIWSWGRIE